MVEFDKYTRSLALVSESEVKAKQESDDETSRLVQDGDQESGDSVLVDIWLSLTFALVSDAEETRKKNLETCPGW